MSGLPFKRYYKVAWFAHTARSIFDFVYKLQTPSALSTQWLRGCGCQMNTIYSTGKGREANKSHRLIIGIAKLYGRMINDAGGR